MTSSSISDLRWNDFPGWDDVSWVQKREHLSYVRQLSGGKVKIVAVSTGMFLEGSLGVSGNVLH